MRSVARGAAVCIVGAVVLALLLTSGGGGKQHSGPERRAPHATVERRAPHATVLGCRAGRLVRVALPPDARERSLRVGPVSLPYTDELGREPASDFASEPERVRQSLNQRGLNAAAARSARRRLRRVHTDSYDVTSTPVVLQPGRRVTIAVPPGARRALGLAYTPSAERGRQGALHRFSSAEPAVTFVGCRDRVSYFPGGLIAAGARCAPLDFYLDGRRSRPIRRTIAFGTSACGSRRLTPHLTVGDAYMGVACSKPNSIACDRVGLAVWLPRPATRLTASIAGRPLTMRMAGLAFRRGIEWDGYLQPAGMKDGALRVQPDRGTDYWIGSHGLAAYVELTAHYRDGSSATATELVDLGAGWG